MRLGFFFEGRGPQDGKRLLALVEELAAARKWRLGPPAMKGRKARIKLADPSSVSIKAARTQLEEIRFLVARLAAVSKTSGRELALELDDELVGALVRGEPDPDIVRFLDRWQAELDARKAPVEPQAEPYEKRNKVSIWLGTFVERKDFDRYLEERFGSDRPISRFAADLGLGFLDHDTWEARHLDRPVPVPDLLRGLSWAESYGEAAERNAAALEITEADTVLMVFDLDATALPQRRPRMAGGRLTFVGVFDFDPKAGTA